MAETKSIKYLGPLGGVEVVNFGTVKRGDSIELPREVADELLTIKESWQPGTAKPGKGE